MAEELRAARPHQIIMQDRRMLTISGVSDVDSFDEAMVVVYTDMGELTVKGEGLHIQRLNVESGDLTVEGYVQTLSYAETSKGKGGLLGRMFK